MGPNKRSRHSFKQHGFSLAEVLLALFFVTMAIALVGGLGQQVMNFAKRASQTGAVIEIRSMMNAISKNSDSWLSQMRSSIETQGVYAGCIPDPTVNITTFSCPKLETNLNDSELNKIAGSVFHVASAPILSPSGEKIAGSFNAPVYLDSQGRTCELSNNKACPLRSIGFFLRSNEKVNENPGNIKFVIKIEKNPEHTANSTPMKPQYLSVDIGEGWKKVDPEFIATCPSGSIKVGYLSSGKPSCVSVSQNCGDGKLPIGIDEKGKAICQSLPDCQGKGGAVVLDSTGKNLVCSSQSPCKENSLFLGYYAGTGEPMCSSSSIKCADGQVQVGISIADGDMKADCQTPPSCTDANKRLSFDGTRFICENIAVAATCTEDQVMSGINSDGSPICVSRAPASTAKRCPSGSYVAGILANGDLECESSRSETFTYYESGEIDLGELGNNNSTGELEVNNPFPGKLPYEVKWYLINKTAEFGFSPGDEVPVDHMTSFSGYISMVNNANKFKVNKRNPWYIAGKQAANNSLCYPKSPKWMLKFRAIYPN